MAEKILKSIKFPGLDDVYKIPSGGASSWEDLVDKPELFSGSWNDLTDKPFYEKEDGEVVQLDEKFIPNSIARIDNLPQSDWSQSDETAVDFVKNRTHYTETLHRTETRELVNGRVTDGEFASLLLENRESAVFTHTNGAVFTYSGEAYPNAWTITTGAGTEEEITMTVSVNGDIVVTRGFASVAVNITEEIVHQLDEKFIPDSIARASDVVDLQVQSDWNQNDENAADFVKNRTHHAETLHRTETRDFDNGRIIDAEFAALLFENKKTAVFTHMNGYTYTYYEDVNPEYSWHVVSDVEGMDPLTIEVRDGTIGSRWFDSVTVNITEEVVHKLDEKFIPDSIARVDNLPQSDWNQNDENAADFVKNRTHYIADEVLIDKQVTLSYGNQDRECYCTHGATLNFEVGATYRIYFDKTIVETVAHNTTYLVVIDGNMTISVSDYYLSVDYPTSRTALFRLEKVNGYCHQLDEKFIPDTIARVSEISQADWNQYNENASDFVKNRTHYIEPEWNEWIDGEILPTNTEVKEGVYSSVHRRLPYAPLRWFSDDLKENDIVEIEWYGETFYCTKINNGSFQYIGNPGLVDGFFGSEVYSDNGIPFCLAHNTAGIAAYSKVNTSENIPIRYRLCNKIYHQLDEKFIPDSIVRTETQDVYNQYITQLKNDIDLLGGLVGAETLAKAIEKAIQDLDLEEYAKDTDVQAVIDQHNKDKQALEDALGDKADKDEVILAPETGSVGQALVIKSVDVNGKPVEWECANAGGQGVAQIQSDWKQTDETAVDFIKNKPSKNDALDLVSEMGFVVPVADAQDNLFVDADGNVYSLV